VIIYSGATILGRVTIGKGAVIGGNVWITGNVPPHTTVSLNLGDMTRASAD
jgi:serine O-acetyltransferase